MSNDTGMAIYGLDEVQKALNIGAVDLLILSEKLDTYKVIVDCSNCGYEENRTAKESDLDKLESSIQEEVCPNCSSNSFSISDSISIIEELGAIAETVGTEVVIISPQTEQGEA
ncbi:MAG: peptide chain release factor 1, partial [Candidatus Hermodarchaeota archaeon]